MSKELEVFNPLKSEITEMVQPVFSLKVSDFQTSQQAVDAAKELKALRKRVEERRKEITDPLRAQVQSVMDCVKQISAPLDQAEAHVRSELNAFAAEQEKLRQAELRRLEDERRKAEEELAAKQAEEAKATEGAAALFGAEPEEAAAVAEKQAEEKARLKAEYDARSWDARQQQVKNTRKTVKVRVVDIEQVPRSFLILEVNEKAAIAAHKAGVKIPGLEFYEDVAVAIGRTTYVPKQALGGR